MFFFGDCNQNVHSAQYKISIDCPTNVSQGELEVNLHESQGGLSGLSPLISDGSWDCQVGWLVSMSCGQRQLKVGHQAQVHSDQTVLDGQAGRLDCVSGG